MRYAPLLFATALAASSLALPPPLEVTREVGYDSAGVLWSVRATADGQISFSGAREFSLRPGARLDHLALHTALDAEDTAWVVDARGHGVRVKLASGASTEVTVPVSAQLVAGIAAEGGALSFGDHDARGTSALARLDISTGKVARLHAFTAPEGLLTFSLGRRHVWVVGWDGLTPARHGLALAGVDKASGKVARSGRRQTAWSPVRWGGLSLAEDEGENVWIADTYSSRVARLDPSGVWRSWRLAPRTPSDITTLGTRAVLLLTRHEQVADAALLPPGMERHRVAERALAVIDPEASRPTTLPLPPRWAYARLRRDRNGVLWLAPGMRVLLEQGRPRLAPIPSAR